MQQFIVLGFVFYSCALVNLVLSLRNVETVQILFGLSAFLFFIAGSVFIFKGIKRE